MIKKILSLSILVLLAITACEKETRTLKVIEDEAIQNYLKANSLTGFVKDSTGFYYKIISMGTGIAVGYPDLVGIYQTTTSINEDASYEITKYNPRFDYLGYIKPDSWRESLRKINKGGEVRVITPSYLAFGKTGFGSTIPGNAILDTKLSLINNVDRPTYEDDLINSYLSEKGITALKDADGIYYTIINPGTGVAITSPNATLKVAYDLKFLGGPLFQQAKENSPLSIVLSNTIQGWIKTLPLIAKGGEIRLFIPSRFGYGTGGSQDGGIPPNTILEFKVKLLDVTN